MNPLFAADLAAIFDGPLAVAATYAPAAGGSFATRVMPSMPDEELTFGRGAISTSTGVFLVPVAAVGNPQQGDIISIDDVGSFVVQGEPKRNERRLWWRIEARPA